MGSNVFPRSVLIVVVLRKFLRVTIEKLVEIGQEFVAVAFIGPFSIGELRQGVRESFFLLLVVCVVGF